MKLDTGRFRVKPRSKVRLARRDPEDSAPFESPAEADGLLEEGVERLAKLQERLFAQNQYAVLLVFQGMDAAGKDSAIKHVMRGLNPQGTQVFSFKTPSDAELDHDYMWRAFRALPERGRIGVFNRSYYEEVLIARVHPHVLARQQLPPRLVTRRLWQDRFDDIVAIERYLARNGTVIRKFFLHISKEQQRRRFLRRLDDPQKNWKFSMGDVKEREYWNDYMRAYEEALGATSTDEAPWFVIPADRKWFARLAIAQVVAETLESLKLAFPRIDPAHRTDLAAARRALERQKG